ncbi:MAG: ATP-binding protein, partial [Flavobacteriales bacterium]
EQRRNVFLVVKEALHNIVKHANATSASVHIHMTKDLLIEIKDSGIGMPSGSELGEGNGLRNMRKRIVTLNGSFEITGSNGTRIRCLIPMPTTTNKGSIA